MEVEIKKEWKNVEYTDDWNDLITEHNWKLMGIREGFILMSRDGYINRFREDVNEHKQAEDNLFNITNCGKNRPKVRLKQ